MRRRRSEMPPEVRESRRRARWRIWHRIVLAIGYAAIVYRLAQGLVYLLVMAEDWF